MRHGQRKRLHWGAHRTREAPRQSPDGGHGEWVEMPGEWSYAWHRQGTQELLPPWPPEGLPPALANHPRRRAPFSLAGRRLAELTRTPLVYRCNHSVHGSFPFVPRFVNASLFGVCRESRRQGGQFPVSATPHPAAVAKLLLHLVPHGAPGEESSRNQSSSGLAEFAGSRGVSKAKYSSRDGILASRRRIGLQARAETCDSASNAP